MADTLTPDQKQYIQGLRSGNIGTSLLDVDKPLSNNSEEDFETFKSFLAAHGHTDPVPADLSLTISRQNMLRILFYADDRDRRCLILQSCFGFDSSPDRSSGELGRVGRVVLIQKGNFQDRGQTDEELFFGDSVFRSEGAVESFLNMDIDQPLSVEEARQLVQNFIDIYPPNRTITNDPFIHGFLLPVKALINILTDPAAAWGQASELTFKWGLTGFNELDGELGNFTLCIGLGDLSTGPVIEFRTEAIGVTGAPSDCPPRVGCAT